MAKEAQHRGCYDRIVVGDAECILHVCKDEPSLDYDFLFACDLFAYIGDLSKVFFTARKCLECRGGVFAFSAEVVSESQESSCGHDSNDDDDEGFVMQSCARFAHKRWNIRSLAGKFEFEILSCKESAVLRKHFDKDVLAALIVLSLPSA